jgi:hypothetical protein
MEKWLKNLMLSALTAEVNEAAPALVQPLENPQPSAKIRMTLLQVKPCPQDAFWLVTSAKGTTQLRPLCLAW